jgi:hypothetical protein
MKVPEKLYPMKVPEKLYREVVPRDGGTGFALVAAFRMNGREVRRGQAIEDVRGEWGVLRDGTDVSGSDASSALEGN